MFDLYLIWSKFENNFLLIVQNQKMIWKQILSRIHTFSASVTNNKTKKLEVSEVAMSLLSENVKAGKNASIYLVHILYANRWRSVSVPNKRNIHTYSWLMMAGGKGLSVYLCRAV